jgi:hypothetical protein
LCSPATQEAEIKRIAVQIHPEQIVHETLSRKNPSKKKGGGTGGLPVNVGTEFKSQYCKERKVMGLCFPFDGEWYLTEFVDLAPVDTALVLLRVPYLKTSPGGWSLTAGQGRGLPSSLLYTHTNTHTHTHIMSSQHR